MSHRWMIDFDGVLADLDSGFLRAVNEKFFTTYTEDSVTDWAWWRRQPKKFADYVWKECFHDPAWFLREVKAYPGAIEALADLLTDGELADDLQIVTARPERHREMVIAWLRQEMPQFDLQNILTCTGGQYPKSHYCAIHRLNTVIDDGLHNFREMNPKVQRLFLADRPWNQQGARPELERVSGLQEAIDAAAGVPA